MKHNISSIMPDPDSLNAGIIRFRSLGDLVMITPVVDMLRAWGYSIDLWTRETFSDMFEHDPRFQNIFHVGGSMRELQTAALKIRNRRYDLLLDLQDTPQSQILNLFSGARVKRISRVPRIRRALLIKTGINTWKYARRIFVQHIRACGYSGKIRFRPKLHISSELKQVCRGKFGLADPDKTIAFVPGSPWQNKRYPFFPESAEMIGQKFPDINAVILGESTEQNLCSEVAAAWPGRVNNLCGKTSVKELPAVMACCRLAITNDSGLLHVAEAVDTPVLAFFGPTTRHLGFYPWKRNSQTLEVPAECRPCHPHGGNTCHRGDHVCMRAIHPRMVLEKAEEYFHV